MTNISKTYKNIKKGQYYQKTFKNTRKSEPLLMFLPNAEELIGWEPIDKVADNKVKC